MGCSRTVLTSLLLAGLGAGAAGGCRSSLFTCETNENCNGLPGGVCEANGFCSTAAEDCDSGRRYAQHSGEFSGRCVDPTGTSDAPTSTSGGTSTTTGPGVSSSSDVGPLDETGMDTSTGGRVGEESSTTTTGVAESTGADDFSVCGVDRVVYEQAFDDGRGLGSDWDPTTIGTAGARVQDETLVVSVDASTSEGYWFAGSQFALPQRGSFVVEVVQPPPADGAGIAWIAVISDPGDLYLEFTPNNVNAVVSEDAATFNTLHSVPYVQELHRWGRLNFDRVGGTVDIELSGDAVSGSRSSRSTRPGSTSSR